MNALIRGDRARQALLLAVACVASVGSGCSLVDRRPKVPIDSAAGLYDSAKIEYKLDAGQLNLPLAVTRVEAQLVSYDQVPSDPRRDASVGTLKIEYPHPEGRPGMARARLEISSTAPSSSAAAPNAESTTTWGKVTSTLNPKRLLTATTAKSQKVDETWELDIPRTYLDEAVTSLNRDGYFDAGSKGTDGVAIVAKVDGKQVNKSWRQVNEFNELMLAVRNQGRLISYTRPSGDAASPDQSAKLAAYQRYAEQDRVAHLATTDAAPSWQPPAAGSVAGSSYPPQSAPGVVPYFPEASQPSPPLPRPDSAPWRVGSHPANALPPAQAPGNYPSTGFGSTAPGSPNVAQQPQWQGTPY